MNELTARERIIRAIEGKPLDRLPTYDIIHNVALIEFLSGKRVTPENAEDVTCKAVSQVLDLVRHFTVPTHLEPEVYEDEDGFVIKEEWWTKAYVSRPFRNVEDARDMMRRDVERIYQAVERKEVCRPASVQCNLLGEKCRTFDEVAEIFRRIAGKIGDTVMIAPESVPGMYTATSRYGLDMVTYVCADYAEDFDRYYQAVCDYEIAKVHHFAGLLDVTPIALVSCELAHNGGLLRSPEFIRKSQFPRIKKVIDAWKSHAFKVIFHADGNKWRVLDDIVSFGVDVVEPCETLATMDIKRMRDLYPDVAIGSPVDCQDLLSRGTPEEVREVCRQVIEDCRGERVLTGSTSEIHPAIPVQNAMAMYDYFLNYHEG